MILLGLELDELSMNPLAIPRVKKIIRGSTLKESKALLKKVIALSSTAEIQACVDEAMRRHFPDEYAVNDQ
jgi:phosphotransferase system enzyme I (PtsI)